MKRELNNYSKQGVIKFIQCLNYLNTFEDLVDTSISWEVCINGIEEGLIYWSKSNNEWVWAF